MTDFDITTGPDGVVSVRGEVDVATAGQLRAALEAQVAAGASTIRVDCRGLEFLDSSGISALLAVRHALGADGALIVDSPPTHVRRVLEISGVLDELTVEN